MFKLQLRPTRELVTLDYFLRDDTSIPTEQVVRLVKYYGWKALLFLLDSDVNTKTRTTEAIISIEVVSIVLIFFSAIYDVGDMPTFIARSRQELLTITLGNILINGQY